MQPHNKALQRTLTRCAGEKEVVKRANERLAHFPRYVRVRRAIVSAEPWTGETGLLTPTLKVKRCIWSGSPICADA